MNMIRISDQAINEQHLRTELLDHSCGAFITFEGWIRNQNEGCQVFRLEYEVYKPLALKEGQNIIQEAQERFPVHQVLCVHREGLLELGDIAVWVGVAAPHRDEAYRASRYIIDEVKHRLPIWKKEYYVNGDSGWVNCERCAEHAHS